MPICSKLGGLGSEMTNISRRGRIKMVAIETHKNFVTAGSTKDA